MWRVVVAMEQRDPTYHAHSDRGIPQTKTADVNERTGGPVPTREDRGVRRNEPRRRAARLRVLSSEPIGARNGPRELELQAASARRLAELQVRIALRGVVKF